MNNTINTQPTTKVISMTIEQQSFVRTDFLNKLPAYTRESLPLKGSKILNPVVVPVKKILGTEKDIPPFFNILIKQVAARLSDIELSLDCNDVSYLQFSTHVLKDMFITMNIPAAYHYTGQLEVMVRENKRREAKYLLQEIKKIIAQLMQSNASKNAG